MRVIRTKTAEQLKEDGAIQAKLKAFANMNETSTAEERCVIEDMYLLCGYIVQGTMTKPEAATQFIPWFRTDEGGQSLCKKYYKDMPPGLCGSQAPLPATAPPPATTSPPSSVQSSSLPQSIKETLQADKIDLLVQLYANLLKKDKPKRATGDDACQVLDALACLNETDMRVIRTKTAEQLKEDGAIQTKLKAFANMNETSTAEERCVIEDMYLLCGYIVQGTMTKPEAATQFIPWFRTDEGGKSLCKKYYQDMPRQ
ncbi:hypothetical protein Q1695_013310 [Nippostrongylus brasiliensis]|nr:hypothetical protein Q1695_013310 [Nippostrongylus brasiliensis]